MLPERIFSTFQTASQGMAVQRERISVAARNIANANTSAPVGSDNVYRPQSVKTTAPVSESFEKALRDSIAPSLKRTRAAHMSLTPEFGAGPLEKPEGMGPTYRVVEQDKFRYEYDPNHPHADENGMVRYPDIDMVKQMIQMVNANRLYEANLSSIQAEKQMIKQALKI